MLETDVFRRDFRKLGFEFGLMCEVVKLFQVADAGSLGGGMLSYFARSVCVGAATCVLELLRFRVRLGLLHKVEVDTVLSGSVSPDSSPNGPEFKGKAEDWVWGRGPVNFAPL